MKPGHYQGNPTFTKTPALKKAVKWKDMRQTSPHDPYMLPLKKLPNKDGNKKFVRATCLQKHNCYPSFQHETNKGTAFVSSLTKPLSISRYSPMISPQQAFFKMIRALKKALL